MADIKAAIEHLQWAGIRAAHEPQLAWSIRRESVGESRRIVLKDLGFDVTTQVDISRGPRFLGRVDASSTTWSPSSSTARSSTRGSGLAELVAEKRRESSITDGGPSSSG